MSAIAAADIGERLRQALRELVVLDERKAIDASFALDATNNVDSVDHVELVMEAEEMFGIEVPDALAVNIKTFGDLERVVTELVAAKATQIKEHS